MNRHRWRGAVQQFPPSLVEFLSSPDSTRDESHEHHPHRVLLILCWLCLQVFLAPTTYALYSIVPNARLSQGAIGVGFVLTLAITPLLIRRGAIRAAGNWAAFALFVSIGVVVLATGALRAPMLCWFVVIPVVASLLADRRSGLFWAVVVAAALLGMYIAARFFAFQFPQIEPGLASLLLGIHLAALAAVLVLVSLLYQSLSTLLIHRARQQRDDIDAVLASAPAAVFALDEDGRTTRSSEAASRLFGREKNAMSGAMIQEFIPTLDSASLSRLDHGTAEVEAHTGTAADGTEIPVSVSVSRYGLHPHYVVIARDMRRERALEQKLRQSDKMKAVGRLAGGVAHDFNNLLSIIAGHAAFLREALEASEALDDLDVVAEAVDRGTSLVEQIVAFSSHGVEKPPLLDLSTAVSTAMSLVQRVLGEHIDVKVVPAPESCTACIHRTRFDQIVFNIVLNARDAMPDGGNLTLSTRVETAEPSGEPWCVIEITDTGEGMSDETQAQIFEPFFTTKDVGEGTGFGLATTHSLVADAGGRIEVESELGVGSNFSIYLPFEAGVPETREDAAEVCTTTTATVMVIEDEPALRRLARRLLESRGFRVIDAADGQEAAALAANCEETIDLIFSDVVMPRMGGLEAVRLIREHHPRARAIFVSGFPQDAKGELQALQRDCFMPKPYAPRQLFEVIDEVLDRVELPGETL